MMRYPDHIYNYGILHLVYIHECELKHSKGTFSLLTKLGWLRLAKVNLLSTLLFVEPIRHVTFSSFN